MIRVQGVAEMSGLAREWNFDDGTALVPTMGALHEGHLEIVRAAKGRNGRVVVSIFVNPLQFGPSEDFGRYPRNLDRDAELLAQAGADVLFSPDAEAITPPGMLFSVDPGPMADVLCGRYRPGHFRGVATIVTKLFQVVRPGHAYFGWKDAQQFILLSKMVRDLNIPVQMHGRETVREPDGLAMSSRNAYLNGKQRAAAPVLYRALENARNIATEGGHDAESLLQGIRQEIDSEPLLKLQYAEAVSLETLEPVDTVVPGHTLVAVAAYAGDTRLIDNVRI